MSSAALLKEDGLFRRLIAEVTPSSLVDALFVLDDCSTYHLLKSGGGGARLGGSVDRLDGD